MFPMLPACASSAGVRRRWSVAFRLGKKMSDTRGAQIYFSNFPGVLRDGCRTGGTFLYPSDIYRYEPEQDGIHRLIDR